MASDKSAKEKLQRMQDSLEELDNETEWDPELLEKVAAILVEHYVTPSGLKLLCQTTTEETLKNWGVPDYGRDLLKKLTGEQKVCPKLTASGRKRKDKEDSGPPTICREKIDIVLTPACDGYLLAGKKWGDISDHDRESICKNAISEQKDFNKMKLEDHDKFAKLRSEEQAGYRYRWELQDVLKIMKHQMHDRYKKKPKNRHMEHLNRIRVALLAAGKAAKKQGAACAEPATTAEASEDADDADDASEADSDTDSEDTNEDKEKLATVEQLLMAAQKEAEGKQPSGTVENQQQQQQAAAIASLAAKVKQHSAETAAPVKPATASAAATARGKSSAASAASDRYTAGIGAAGTEINASKQEAMQPEGGLADVLKMLQATNPDAAAAALAVLNNGKPKHASSPTPSAAVVTDGDVAKDVNGKKIQKGSLVQLLVIKANKPAVVVATGTVDDADCKGKAILDAVSRTKAKPGLVVLSNVKVDDDKEKAAKSLFAWQSLFDKSVHMGTTTLWDIKQRLNNGMKLPVPPEVLRVVEIKVEK